MFGSILVLLVVTLCAVIFLRSRRRLADGQRMVRIRLGRAVETLGPGGTVFSVPFIDMLQPVPEGKESFRGRARATFAGTTEIEPVFEGLFTIRDAVAACQGLPVFSASRIPSLRELEPYVVGSLAAQLKGLVETADGDAAILDTRRLARKLQSAANAQLKPAGLSIESLEIPDLGLPSHLAAEWALRAYERQGSEDSPHEPHS